MNLNDDKQLIKEATRIVGLSKKMLDMLEVCAMYIKLNTNENSLYIDLMKVIEEVRCS